jgi:hypothetical protein
VHHEGAGEWLIGGQNGLLAFYRDAVLTPLRGPAQKAHLATVSGDFKDLAVMGGSLANGSSPALFACVGQHWLKPLELPDVTSLPALARVDDERWLVAGRERSGRAMLAYYLPLEWRIERLGADDVRAYLAGASAAQADMGAVVGAGGRVIRAEGNNVTRSTLPDGADLSACALEDSGVLWAASLGKLWMQPTPVSNWECVWKDSRWNVPIISLYADGRRILGVAADGGMIEGISIG